MELNKTEQAAEYYNHYPTEPSALPHIHIIAIKANSASSNT